MQSIKLGDSSRPGSDEKTGLLRPVREAVDAVPLFDERTGRSVHWRRTVGWGKGGWEASLRHGRASETNDWLNFGVRMGCR